MHQLQAHGLLQSYMKPAVHRDVPGSILHMMHGAGPGQALHLVSAPDEACALDLAQVAYMWAQSRPPPNLACGGGPTWVPHAAHTPNQPHIMCSLQVAHRASFRAAALWQAAPQTGQSSSMGQIQASDHTFDTTDTSNSTIEPLVIKQNDYS